jgi:single-strand DNA-binding protein
MVNSVTVVGNLGIDPQTRSLPFGDSVANFSLATTERFKDRNGAKQERTEWHRIVVSGKLADTCASYLNKGRQVLCRRTADDSPQDRGPTVDLLLGKC